MQKVLTEKIAKEKRSEHRPATSKEYRVEIKFVGEPIYQFRLGNVTNEGASILIKDDSAFLNMIEVGQIADATFLSPKGSNPSGIYKIQIKHISAPSKQEHKGHRLVGISIVEKFGQN